MRLVVLIVLVLVAVWLIRRALRGAAPQETLRRDAQGEPADLVRCAHCGLHLPRAEARQGQGALYCSEEHARLGSR